MSSIIHNYYISISISIYRYIYIDIYLCNGILLSDEKEKIVIHMATQISIKNIMLSKKKSNKMPLYDTIYMTL